MEVIRPTVDRNCSQYGKYENIIAKMIQESENQSLRSAQFRFLIKIIRQSPSW
jgi:hypothetical protein